MKKKWKKPYDLSCYMDVFDGNVNKVEAQWTNDEILNYKNCLNGICYTTSSMILPKVEDKERYGRKF